MAKAPTKEAPEAAPAPATLEDLKQPGGITRRKINRGSTRRINRATTTLVDALKAFATEIDKQIYMTDEDGKKTGKCYPVEMTEKLAADLPNIMAAFTHPPAAPIEAPDETKPDE